MNMRGDATALRGGREQQQVTDALIGLAVGALRTSPTKQRFANDIDRKVESVPVELFAEDPGCFTRYGLQREIIALLTRDVIVRRYPKAAFSRTTIAPKPFIIRPKPRL